MFRHEFVAAVDGDLGEIGTVLAHRLGQPAMPRTANAQSRPYAVSQTMSRAARGNSAGDVRRPRLGASVAQARFAASSMYQASAPLKPVEQNALTNVSNSA